MLTKDETTLKTLPPLRRMPTSGHVLGMLVLLVVGVLVLSGCAPRPPADLAAAHTADSAGLIIDLPPLAIDVDEQGALSIGHVPLAPRLSALHALMRPPVEMRAHHDAMTAQLAALAVPAPWIDFLQSSNVQSLQLNTHPQGLLLLVNGDPLPSLAWDAESLRATAQTLALSGVAETAALEAVLPAAQHLGVGVVVRFPVPAGETALPLYGQGDSHGAAEVRTAQAAFLQAVGAPPRIHIPITYQADGSVSVGTLAAEEWTALTGLPWSQLHLDPALLERLSQAGVAQVGLLSDADGTRVAVNGEALPSLRWANGEVVHLLGVTEQMALGQRWAPGVNWQDVSALVRSLLPVVQSTEFDLTVSLPPSPLSAVAASR